MLTALLAFGLWPLVVVVVASIILIIFLENDGILGATITALIGGGVLLVITTTNPLPWLALNAGGVLLGILAYIAIGVVYSFPKWYFYLLRERDRFKDSLRDFHEDSQDRIYKLAHYVPPTALKNKSRIIGWMTYWPWSALWTLLNDPIRRAYRMLYAQLAGSYEKISANVFGTINTDVAAAKARYAELETKRRGY